MEDRSIQEWLHSSEISLPELIPLFQGSGIQSVKHLLEIQNPITDQYLQKLGVSKIGFRKKLLSKIQVERERLAPNEQTVTNSNQEQVIHPQAGTPLDILTIAHMSKQSPRLVSNNGPVHLSDLANVASMHAQHSLQTLPNYTGQPPSPPSNMQSDIQLSSSPNQASSIGNLPLNNRSFSPALAIQNFHAFTVPRELRTSFVNSPQQQQQTPQPPNEIPNIVWYKIKDATGNKRKRAANLSSLETVETPPDFVHNQLIYPFPAVHIPQRMQPAKCIVKLYGKGPSLADAPTANPEDKEYSGGLGADIEVTFSSQERVFVFDKVKIIHLKKQDKMHKLFLFKFLIYDNNGSLLGAVDSGTFKILTHISQRGKDGNTSMDNNEIKKPKKPKPQSNPVSTNPFLNAPVSAPSTNSSAPSFLRMSSSLEAIPVMNAIPVQTPLPNMTLSQPLSQ